MRSAIILAILTVLLSAGEPPTKAPVIGTVPDPFLARHCGDCHDAASKKGGLDLSALGRRLDGPDTLATWVKVHDRIRAGEMPPPARKERPAAGEVQTVLAALASDLTAGERALAKRDGRARLRRLNRVEFENALRDLLVMPGLRLKESLPGDGREHGFDRSAAALDTSFVHIETYLAAVDQALNAALCPLPAQPPVFKYRFRPWDNNRHNGREGEWGFGSRINAGEGFGLIGLKRDPTLVFEKYRFTNDTPVATAIGVFRHEDADHSYKLTAIAPVLTGWHRIRISGYSFAWDGKDPVATDRCGALSVGIFSKGEHYGTIGLPPNQPAEGVLTAWLERGGGMTHGLSDGLRVNPASCEKIRDHGKKTGPPAPCPGVAIEWIEIEGPLHDQWPPASHRALFGDLPVTEWTKTSATPQPRQQVWPRGNPGAFPVDPYGENGQKRPLVQVVSPDPARDAQRLLAAFLPRAFRRPVTGSEMATHLAIVSRRLADGAAFQDAMLAAYRAALTSPAFLFVHEPTGALGDHVLAQRLAGMLWSSLPDAALAQAADRGELAKPAGLRAHTERLLGDAKAQRFVEDFLGQWLDLRDINSTQPDTKLYPEFMPWVQEAMVLETQAFFRELLKDDLGVVHVVKSPFAMLNEPLARLYGVSGVSGWNLRKVVLPAGSVRGGFLTQASVLKITANGTTTSPVKRGVFVLEKLLGIIPTPPPPDAGSIEPDVRGATTVRQQLEKHRSNPTCAGCHQKMDGYGFALESFDVAGAWRERYRAMGGGALGKIHGHGLAYHFGPAVDCTGTMPDGRPFQDVNALRDLLAADPAALARAFVQHLVVYATGAGISFADRATVDAIVARAKARDYGLRTLIHEVVQSDLFRSR